MEAVPEMHEASTAGEAKLDGSTERAVVVQRGALQRGVHGGDRDAGMLRANGESPGNQGGAGRVGKAYSRTGRRRSTKNSLFSEEVCSGRIEVAIPVEQSVQKQPCSDDVVHGQA